MKFIVVEIQKMADGTVGNLVTAYDTKAEAESHYHLVLSSAAISNLPAHSAVLLDETAFVYKRECYKHPIPETTGGEQ